MKSRTILLRKCYSSTLILEQAFTSKHSIMFYDVPSDFYQVLSSKFDSAVENDNLRFSGAEAKSEVIHIDLGKTSVDFQTTLLHSLKERPVQGTIEANPFASPEPELTILDSFGEDHEFRVVFNKFPVVPRHFMLLTKAFKSQNTPLSSTELLATFSLLHSLKSQKNEDWFAFYNCGPESGASQPHKHVQFMTLPSSENFVPYADRLSSDSEPFIPTVRDEPLQNGDLPFAHFVARLPDDSSDLVEDDLTSYFVSLLQRTLTVLRANGAKHISYNFAFTTKYMLMVPRSVGKYKDMGINSCGIMGLLLCKNQELLDMVNTDGPVTILREVGFPSTAGQKEEEHDY